jgi:hypothetical protein
MLARFCTHEPPEQPPRSDTAESSHTFLNLKAARVCDLLDGIMPLIHLAAIGADRTDRAKPQLPPARSRDGKRR